MSVTRLQRVVETDRREMVPFKEVCTAWLSIHPNTGYRIRSEGRFPLEVVIIGGRFFCRRSDLERYAGRTPTVVAL